MPNQQCQSTEGIYDANMTNSGDIIGDFIFLHMQAMSTGEKLSDS